MSELKTQKDIHTSYGPYEDSDVELYKKTERQEAIKWIKELRDEKVIAEAWKGEGKYSAYFDADGGEFNIIIEWIKHFFNITEGELK